MKALTTDTIYDYLAPKEAEACRAYLGVYSAEYERLRDRETEELEVLRYWSELAHSAGKAARDRVMERMPTSPTTGMATSPVSTADQLRLELGGQG